MSRTTRPFRPVTEPCEERRLLSTSTTVGLLTPAIRSVLLSFNATRPTDGNAHVVPSGAAPGDATFIDPTATVDRPQAVALGQRTYVAPYALLDAATGYIKVGSHSAVLDSASIKSNPDSFQNPPAGVVIGDNVLIDPGAVVDGPASVGDFGRKALPTEIGPGAEVDRGTVEPGVIVGALARVGPGVTIPTGFAVLPGKQVVTAAEGLDPSLGMVARITPQQEADLAQRLAREPGLAAIDVPLYRAGTTHFTQTIPQSKPLTRGQVSDVSVRADDGQPIAVGPGARLGTGVVVNGPTGGSVSIGRDFTAGNRAVVLGSRGAPTTLGDSVIVGSEAVVDQSTVGAGSAIGAHAYVRNSQLPPGSVVPANAIVIGNKVQGYAVGW